MSDIVEQHGGFVDKYIGDAIVAVFGAPHEDPDHALNAVRSALACRERLSAMQAELGLPGGHSVWREVRLPDHLFAAVTRSCTPDGAFGIVGHKSLPQTLPQRFKGLAVSG